MHGQWLIFMVNIVEWLLFGNCYKMEIKEQNPFYKLCGMPTVL
jgi:hypothetical protein